MASVPPEVDLNGDGAGFESSVDYSENDPVVLIAPEATVSDRDSDDFEGGVLTVDFRAGGEADDQLRIVGEDFAVDETDLYYQGVPVGTIGGGMDVWTPLVVTFNDAATADIVAALIRSIGYVSYSGAPGSGERQIGFQLTDGDGGTSIVRIARVQVAATETAPLAQDDRIATIENEPGTGSLFADNGGGVDSDPDGPALAVASVNGSEANVGVEIILDSGARLTVHADGTYVYDPNGRFDGLTDGGGGAVNSSATDTFTYALAGGNSATVTVTVFGVATPGDRLMGDEYDNYIEGTSRADVFLLDQGGFDSADGLEADDIFYFGAELTGDEMVRGGAGHDSVVLQGDYGSGLVLGNGVTGIEAISILAGTNRSFGGSGEELYDYSIVTHDSNFAAGVRAKINAGALLAGEDFTFDGSAETDASFLIYGGLGTDTLTGGLGNDIFFLDSGRFGAGDRVSGGQGYDGLFLRGNYVLDLGSQGFAGALGGIESLTLTSAADRRYARGGGSEFDYDLTLGDGIVGEGETLTVSGALLAAGETMIVDGSGETDGQLRLFGGAADDRLTGGAEADLIHGNLGADTLAGSGGADIFRYQDVAESGPRSMDRILDFEAGTDKIDLSRIDADPEAAGDQAFIWIGSEAFSGSAGELRAYERDGSWYVEGDSDGDAVADLVIALTLDGPAPLGAGDFLL